MSEYWRAKIWGLLHDPVLKALHNNSGRGGNSFYQQLEVMQSWVENGWDPETSGGTVMKRIKLADYIASASDRGAIGSVTASVNYAPGSNRDQGLEVSHLLSGAKREFKIKQHSELVKNRQEYLESKEQKLLEAIPSSARENSDKGIKALYWWLWRCLPEATCQEFDDASLMVMPAETRLPDSSIWNHASITSALAGALVGYDLTAEDIKRWTSGKETSHPYLAVFSFTPVQELIKASRKMRDFWAGSWILHYLSAKVSWKLALKYGPDTLLYPSLYQQPLIDHWILKEFKEFPEFSTWIKTPTSRSILTAGFPNVLVLVLPKDKVKPAMQMAKQTLLQEWRNISKTVFADLQKNRHWMPDLKLESSTWEGWLKSQWQTYWSALPIGKEGEELKNAAIPLDREDEFMPWLKAQNQAYNLSEQQKLFQAAELEFLREAYQQRFEKQGRRFSVNVGSWWAHIFDQTRYSLAAVKNARNWELPTAFGPRSTVSGIGSVVHPGGDWITEGETKKLWSQHAGLFDGREQLNATETIKRGLHQILPELLEISDNKIAASYPDLTSGVAGYLKNHDNSHLQHFHQACLAVKNLLQDKHTQWKDKNDKWGIPWIDENPNSELTKHHPRLLNSGWLIEDLDIDDELRNAYRQDINQTISKYYPNNNPANWYVLAAGDGDGMSEWLKGAKLQTYGDYIPSELAVSQESLKNFLEQKKRMGPSTHSALSRALLDFSNQLVPYLTEQRYAGRLIYGGGDDVLAYTNLWEWDKWLWDIRQCFRGDNDPRNEFDNQGDYWHWHSDSELPEGIHNRPLFTMGRFATISFGMVIAHHSVPLAIALENLWEAEAEAKEHSYLKNGQKHQKDAVQVRVMYGNGNILKATTKFDVFYQWQTLTSSLEGEIDAAIFEQAATLWNQHPAPIREAIAPWTKSFCDRRDQFQGDEIAKQEFQQHLTDFLSALWDTTTKSELDAEIQTWLKIAAFTIRNRRIEL